MGPKDGASHGDLLTLAIFREASVSVMGLAYPGQQSPSQSFSSESEKWRRLGRLEMSMHLFRDDLWTACFKPRHRNYRY